ncbi:MAG: RsmB/NOP family class I SAM-dependent RNA methyltransferase [candidate division Zixibacteria bacterium]|nr:RsmB/NOP family class I SAM-dependent RNA methyltransferase [candidate division Zixibacteria bacterium]
MREPVEIPEEFKRRYGPLVDDEQAFFASLIEPPLNSFRVNTLKAPVGEVIGRLDTYGIHSQPLPWYEDAFTTESRELTSTLERFLGTIYIQEAASMLPPLIMREELSQASTVFDACAAPGSKATQIAAIMNNRGSLVANDRNFRRIRALKFNLNKAGVINTVITNFSLQKFPPVKFDIVLLDAPCSSDGTVRKNPEVMNQWSVSRIRGCSAVQKELIKLAFDFVTEGGMLVYSTCSLAPEENEMVIDHLLRHRPAKVKPIALDGFAFTSPVMNWAGETMSSGVAACARVWPHINNTDGFFVAKVSK